jgi:hypothetical protein
MMQKFELKSSTASQTNRFGPMPPDPTSALSAEEKSKDVYFVQLARITEAMIAEHGKDFAMGTLILSARFIAEGKPLIKRNNDAKSGDQPSHTHSSNCGCS